MIERRLALDAPSSWGASNFSVDAAFAREIDLQSTLRTNPKTNSTPPGTVVFREPTSHVDRAVCSIVAFSRKMLNLLIKEKHCSALLVFTVCFMIILHFP